MKKSRDIELFKFPFLAMGSPCEIQLYAADKNSASHIASQAIADVARMEQRYSRYRADSVLSAINRVAATGGTIQIDDETASLLNYADACYQQSDGLFDITSGVLRKAWNFKSGRLPEEKQLTQLLARIGWKKVRRQGSMLTLPAGMELDFGGIVKEYTADRVATLCWNAGVHHGIVNLGGDIRIIGPHPDGSAWCIGIRHPRQKNVETSRVIELHRGAVASSGDYERCIEIDGIRYGHILNPKTGWPVQHMASVTVVADFCVIAGSASTIGMLKQQEGPKWLETLGLRYFWVDVYGNTGGNLN